MKIQIITVGAPKLGYAKAGWQEYTTRLKHYHQLQLTHIADKHNDAEHILSAITGNGAVYVVALTITGKQYTSRELASFLDNKAQQGRELCFIIGGPDGLPRAVLSRAEQELGLSNLTFPHDLAMVVLAESLYRASTINNNQNYHH